MNVLDHEYLNDILDDKYATNPSAERIIKWIKEKLEEGLSVSHTLQRIRLYETEGSYAEWRRK